MLRKASVSYRKKSEASRSETPGWTIEPLSSRNYKFVIKVNHPNLKKIELSLRVDRFTSDDHVAEYIQNYVSRTLSGYTYLVYAFRGFPINSAIPYEDAKVNIRPGIGYPQSIMKLRSPIEVNGNLSVAQEVKAQMICSTCGAFGAPIECRGGGCEKGTNSFCSQDCEAKSWHVSAHHVVCQTK